MYTGHEQDDTGQTYMNARYYLADRGQFISPDRVIQDVYNPADLNHYSYVRNSPYKYIDPNGYDAYVAGTFGWRWDGGGHTVLLVGTDQDGYTLYSYSDHNGGRFDFEPKTYDSVEDALVDMSEKDGGRTYYIFSKFETTRQQDKKLRETAESLGKIGEINGENACQCFVTDALDSIGIKYSDDFLAKASGIVYSVRIKVSSGGWNYRYEQNKGSWQSLRDLAENSKGLTAKEILNKWKKQQQSQNTKSNTNTQSN